MNIRCECGNPHSRRTRFGRLCASCFVDAVQDEIRGEPDEPWQPTAGVPSRTPA